MNSPRDWPALDGLRGVAILWVIPHNADFFPPSHDWTLPFALLAHSGWIGVQIFFVLSGFLITGKLLESRGADNYYFAFYVRRLLRIFPLYFLTLAFFLLLLPNLVIMPQEVLGTYSEQRWLWIFLSNWPQPFHGTVYWFPHLWSLAVEEQFYLIWPILIAFFTPRAHIALCVVLIVVALAARITLLLMTGNPELSYMWTVCRMDALAAGALAALVVRDIRLVDRLAALGEKVLGLSLLAAILGAGASHFFATRSRITITLGYPLLALVSVVLLLTCCGGLRGPLAIKLRTLLSSAWLRSVGRYSFAMYVFHVPLVLLIPAAIADRARGAGSSALLCAIAVVTASYLCAMLSYYVLERHFLGLKRLVNPRIQPSAVVPDDELRSTSPRVPNP